MQAYTPRCLARPSAFGVRGNGIAQAPEAEGRGRGGRKPALLTAWPIQGERSQEGRATGRQGLHLRLREPEANEERLVERADGRQRLTARARGLCLG